MNRRRVIVLSLLICLLASPATRAARATRRGGDAR